MGHLLDELKVKHSRIPMTVFIRLYQKTSLFVILKIYIRIVIFTQMEQKEIDKKLKSTCGEFVPHGPLDKPLMRNRIVGLNSV